MDKQKLIYKKSLYKLDELRKQFLSSRNAKKYTYLCDYLGIEPEDSYLYEVGKLESKIHIIV